jgi:hypothetical protein
MTLLQEGEEPPKIDSITLDPQECLDDIEATLRREKEVRKRLSQHRLLSISYESLLNEPEDTHREICEFLGVKYLPLTTTTKKIVKTNMCELISNYDELMSRFKSTIYSNYLNV